MASAKRNGVTNFIELSEVGQHHFEELSTGQYLFMSSRLNLKCKMAHFEGKIVNHASKEMLCLKGCILDDAKFHCQLLARTMHQSCLLMFKENFLLKNICKYENRFCYGLWSIHR